MRGSLPLALASLDGLAYLDLRDNALAYPETAEARQLYNQATIRCQVPVCRVITDEVLTRRRGERARCLHAALR